MEKGGNALSRLRDLRMEGVVPKSYEETEAGYGGHNIQKQPIYKPGHVTSSKWMTGEGTETRLVVLQACGEVQGYACMLNCFRSRPPMIAVRLAPINATCAPLS
jgi:hypothetical protein